VEISEYMKEKYMEIPYPGQLPNGIAATYYRLHGLDSWILTKTEDNREVIAGLITVNPDNDQEYNLTILDYFKDVNSTTSYQLLRTL